MPELIALGCTASEMRRQRLLVRRRAVWNRGRRRKRSGATGPRGVHSPAPARNREPNSVLSPADAEGVIMQTLASSKTRPDVPASLLEAAPCSLFLP